MKIRYFWCLALSALLWGAAAQAQRGARFASVPPTGRHIYAVGRTTSIRTGRRSGFVSATRGFTSGFGFTNLYPGTALGVNGINSITNQNNLGVEAAIDPATQWNLALAERLLRVSGGIFSGGYYLLSGGGAYGVPVESAEADQPVQEQQQQPQVIIMQQAPVQSPAQVAQESAIPSLPDVGQFVLILQDGKQIQAIAFTQMNDRIIYITSDGSRRTIALSDLDTNATVRVNQERGTPLQPPL